MGNIDKIELLSKLGLNKTQIKVYEAILQNGNCKLNKISAESDVPQSRIYEFVESLHKEGFIKETSARPKRYQAINPEEIISLKMKRLDSEIRDLSGRIMNIWDVTSEKEFEKPFIVSESYSILTEYKKQLKKSSEIKCYVGTFWKYMRIEKIWKSVKKDSKMKIITDQDINPPNDNILIKTIKQQVEYQFTVFDNKNVFLIIEQRPNEFDGIFFSDKRTAKVLIHEFDINWGKK